MPRPITSVQNVECLKATDKALLCLIDGDEKWIPRSVIDEDSEVQDEGDDGELIIHAWFAEKEEIG